MKKFAFNLSLKNIKLKQSLQKKLKKKHVLKQKSSIIFKWYATETEKLDKSEKKILFTLN